MKYRVKIADPYHQQRGHLYMVERKDDDHWFSSWESVLLADDMEEAGRIMREDIVKQKNLISKNLPVSGTVVKEFDESDLIMEKLRGE